MDETADATDERAIHHREITLADGRYMIFYTFDDGIRCDEEENEQGKDV